MSASPNFDFDAVARAALAQCHDLLPRWFPAGRFLGHEFVIGDLYGTPGESLSINTRTGQWADFSTDDRGGDLISLFAAMHRIKQIDAAKQLGDILGGAAQPVGRTAQVSPLKTRESVEWDGIFPIPANAPAPPARHPIHGEPVHVARYRDLNGAIIALVYRCEPEGGRKQVVPLTYCRRADGRTEWRWQSLPKPRSLYHAELLKQSPGARVLVVEGEPKCDAVNAILPKAWIAISWSNGAKSWKHCDWRMLSGRDVTIWPDADDPGRDAGRQIAAQLEHFGAAVRVLSPPPDVPDGWDVGDAIRDGWDAEPILAFIESAIHHEKIEQIHGSAILHDEDAYGAHLPLDEIPPAHDADPADPVQALVREFNEKYFVVNEAGKSVIYYPTHDAALRRDRFDRISFQDFRNLYLNRLVNVGPDKNGKPVLKTAAEVWLRHRGRRQFIGGITFDPSNRHSDDPTILNLWRGFSVKPAPGDWSLLRCHIRDIVCRGNAGHFAYFINWMAHMVQFPGRQGEVAIVVKGGEGTGKGIVARAMLRILGQHGLSISNAKHLTGNFNGHLRDCVFLFADEAFFAGDRQHVGTLKSLITEPYLTIEAKYANAQQMANFLHIFMASNEEWVVPAALDARRFFVLEADKANANNHTYFGMIQDQLDAGGHAAMLHDLLAVDLTGFNIRAIPITTALQTQRKLSLPIPELWWHDCLQREYVFRSRLGLEQIFARWHEEIATDLLFASYCEFSHDRIDRHRMSRETFGRFMVQFGCRPKRLFKAPVGERIGNVTINQFGDTKRIAEAIIDIRPTGYRVGTLKGARDAFESETKLDVHWESAATEQMDLLPDDVAGQTSDE